MPILQPFFLAVAIAIFHPLHALIALIKQ